LLANVSTMGVGGFLIRTVVIALLAYYSTRLLKGVYVKDFSAAFVLALLLALLSATIGWGLSILATPIDFLTFSLFSGLISLLINAVVIKIADGLLGDFRVDSFWWALALSLTISAGTSLLNMPFGVRM